MATPDTQKATLPINPFEGLQPHFGMLLGVEDLATLQGYASGKVRLHNAWLHRAGTVWGLRVDVNDRRELRVQPGFALDGLGRELHLDRPVCVDAGAWYAENRAELGLPDAPVGTRLPFPAEVVICFAGCLDRPVPGIADTCTSSGDALRYSRLREEVEVRLRPSSPPPPPAPPDHRVRVLFGLDAPVPGDDDEVVAARAAALGAAPAARAAALVAALRRFAADDAMALQPAQGLVNPGWPEKDPACVLLATLQLTLERTAQGFVLVDDASTPPAAAPVVDPSVRPSHLATFALQDLLCAALAGGAAGATDAGGARFDAATVALAGNVLTLVATQPLTAKSAETGFAVSRYDDANGWAAVAAAVALDAAGTTATLTLTLPGPLPADTWLRVVAAGTGSRPILTRASLVPLGGAVGGPPGTATQGNDFTHFWKVS